MNCSYYQSQGFSMEPFLLDGDELIVNTALDVSYHIGDIVLYRSPNHLNPVAHRLVSLDRQSSSAVFRSDANPLMTDSLGIEAILGKVEYVRRGGKLIRVGGTIPRRLVNRAVAMVRPTLFRVKDAVTAALLPAVTGLQGTWFYRRWASRLLTPHIDVAQPDSSDGVRITATVNGRFAGRLDLHARRKNGRTIGWISSLSVRARYRGAGIATALLKAAERHAEKGGVQELCVEHARDNRPAEKLYCRMGFEVVDPSVEGNGRGPLQRRKTAVRTI